MHAESPVPERAPRDLDVRAIGRDLDALRREIDARQGNGDDVRHLGKIAVWGRLCAGLGYATAWIAPNPISALLLSQGTFTRWTMVAHHVMHRGYDKAPGVPPRLTSRRFARGWRRYIDWLDWMVPEAWDHEHNTFHHYYTGEVTDPDLVERNIEFLRTWRAPAVVKAVFLGFLMCTWKLLYYAPNTTWLLQRVEVRARRAAADRGKLRAVMPDDHRPISTLSLLLPVNAAGRDFWRRAVLPNGVVRFVLTPLVVMALGQSLPLGPWAPLFVLTNLVLAEIITNVHAFLMIVPSHAAADLYRFESPVRSRDEFYVRQVLTSANYRCGGDGNDFLHGWLNYQIEHHLWPDLSMRQYQQIQPRVRAICERHGLPYIQESVFRRFAKLWRILLGTESMRVGRERRAVMPPRFGPTPPGSVAPRDRIGAEPGGL